MKILFTLIKLFFLLFCSVTFAQYKISIDATILDKYSKEPLSFAQVKINEKNIKAITNIFGHFHLEYDEANILETDTITFLHSGYKEVSTRISELYKLLKNTNKIYLIPLSKSDYIISSEANNQTKDNVFGIVTSEQGQLQGVSVMIKNSLKEAQTDVHGKYQINAEKEDILVFSFLGMKTQEIIINEKKQIDVFMVADGTLLDEVELYGKTKKERKINLGLGSEKSIDAIGTSVNVFTEKDIKSYHTNLNDVIGGKFAGIPWVNSKPGQTPIYKFRSLNSLNNDVAAIYDVDGQIFDTNAPGNPQVPIIDVQNISSISVLKSLAATTKYGTIGRGGVIVIRTKTASGGKAELKQPSALVTGNDYVEQVQNINVLNLRSDYLQTLQNAQSFEEVKQVYKTLKQTKDNLSIAFYLDAAEYFLKWDNTYAMDIFSDVEDLAKDNAKALKSIAFKYEALNMYEEARLVYQNITLLRPTDAQSYRDLALIYVNTGYYNEAMRLYKQMLNNSIEDVDFSGLQQPITDELMHLLTKHRSKVDYTDIPTDMLATKFKQDLRIVFEWNDPNAEFELQFVNPQKKFFKWSHTKFDNRERMLDEIKKGYTTEAYIIDDADTGEWIINLESLNETQDINPNYLKYTIYKNYGLPNETKTVKVIQLESIIQKVTLDKFMYE